MAPKTKPRALRVPRNMTLSPRSEALLEALASRTGIPRGRIVDLALGNVTACPACKGRGSEDSHLGPDTRACGECCGACIVPGSGE